MKLLLILTTTAIGALGCNAHFESGSLPKHLARAIDPSTMDPARFSVLSVLKVAMPTGPDVPFPTGDVTPEWYAKLPEDVKTLLVKLYPATNTAATTTPKSLITAPTSSSAVSESPLSVTTSSSAPSTAFSPLTSAITVTKTLQYASTALNGSGSVLSTGNTVPTQTSTNGTLATSSSAPTGVFSTGAKTVVRTNVLAAVTWVTLGMGFFLFA